MIPYLKGEEISNYFPYMHAKADMLYFEMSFLQAWHVAELSVLENSVLNEFVGKIGNPAKLEKKYPEVLDEFNYRKTNARKPEDYKIPFQKLANLLRKKNAEELAKFAEEEAIKIFAEKHKLAN